MTVSSCSALIDRSRDGHVTTWRPVSSVNQRQPQLRHCHVVQWY